MAELRFDPDSGVVVPTTQEVRDDLAAGFQEAFRTNDSDPDLNVDPSSPMGQVVDLATAEVEAKNAELAYLANMFNPRTASGNWLDALAALYGLTRKVSEPTVVVCTCTGLAGTIIPYGAIVQDTSGNKYRHRIAGGVQIGSSGTIDTEFSSVDHGAIEVSAGAITQIVTVVAGWDSVSNAAPGVIGRDLEPDGELLNRMVQSYAINANGTVANIQANLAELDGVLDVVVLENYTNQEQIQYSVTLDPHSIAVCIVGGEDEDIARTIFQRKSGGCGTTGDTQIEFVDTEHFNARYVYQIIRPSTQAFKVQITFFEEDMNADQKAAVQQAVVSDFLGELSNPRVKLATTVYASRFYQCVQNATDSPIKEIQIGLGDGALSTSVEVPANISPAISTDSVVLVFGGGS